MPTGTRVHDGSTDRGPLEGTRVLDLSRLLPGPFCALVLADMGAEVVKIEPPGVGDYERQIQPLLGDLGYRFRMLNRGKKSVALDLKRPEGREAFLRLAGRADVVIEGFRPGVMDRLGLGGEFLRQNNPDLVFCSISSYGQRGPRRDKVAHDLNILAEIGLLDLMGRPQEVPSIPGVQLADSVSALYAVIGILGALLGRSRTGLGRQVDVSMQDCAFSLMYDAARTFLAEGRVPERGAERLTGALSNYAVYETRDGRHLAVGSLEKKFKDALLERMGLSEYVDASGGVTTSQVRREQEAELRERLAAAFREKTQGQWLEILEPLNACVSAVKTVAEAASDEHLRERGMWLEAPLEGGGRFTAIGPAVRLGEPRVAPAPRLGEHTREALLEVGYTTAEIADLERQGVVATPGAAAAKPKANEEE